MVTGCCSPVPGLLLPAEAAALLLFLLFKRARHICSGRAVGQGRAIGCGRVYDRHGRGLVKESRVALQCMIAQAVMGLRIITLLSCIAQTQFNNSS